MTASDVTAHEPYLVNGIDVSTIGTDCEYVGNPWGEEADQSSSWTPVDMSAHLSSEPIVPDLGRRDDGNCLFYRGRVHWVYSTYESGKTWFCLYHVAQVLIDGGTALYIDFEDTGRAIGERLALLGVPLATVRDQSRFVYLSPDVPVQSLDGAMDFARVLDRNFGIAVLDGVTESFSLEQLKDADGADIATWQRLLPRSIAKKTGAAVLCIDHVPKNPNNQAAPTGSQHKMSGLDGAAFTLVREDPFRKGHIGKSHVRVSKDRNGGVREFGIDYNASDNTHLVGTFVMDSTDPSKIDARIEVESAASRVRSIQAALEDKARLAGVEVWNANGPINTGDLYLALGWQQGGRGSQENAAALILAVKREYIVRGEAGRAKPFSRGSKDPRVAASAS